MTLVDLTHDELRALAAQQGRGVHDPSREADLHSVYGKACEALHDPDAFKPKPPYWAHIPDEDELPDELELSSIVMLLQGRVPAGPCQLVVGSAHLQQFEIAGFLHVASVTADKKLVSTS